ncbi:MAG: alpha/beta hydrolase [Suilimivivens sp.]
MAHIDCIFYSPSLEKNAHVIVFLPSVSTDDFRQKRKTHYYEKSTRFPVLYLLHGSTGGCMSWCLKTGIERYAQDKGIAVVMPSGENSFYLDMAYGEKYLTYIGKELPEFMRTMFPLSEKREETYIAGLSMGGYGAYRVGLEFPETFGYVASLSGSLDLCLLLGSDKARAGMESDSYMRAVFKDVTQISGSRDDLIALLKLQMAEKIDLPQMYMNCGTQDAIFPANESFYQTAAALGAEIKYERFPGEHNWDFWDEHIKDVLNWLP